jgi:Zn-dependent protease with chaperone function
MYLLVVVALALIGAGGAQALFFGRDLGDLATAQACLLNHGIRLPDPNLSATMSRGFAGCAGPYGHAQALVMLTGAAAVPALAWLLMLGGGLTMRLRLRRRGGVGYDSAALRAATRRFEHWCDALGLSGHRRPRLLLGRPGRLTAQAYTTAVPLSRPVVVIPAGYAYLDTAQLDLVVLHELAHVRARDLTWASATWWAGWLSLPVLLAALVPLMRHPSLVVSDYAAALWLAAALSLATLTLRAAVLRWREQTADRYAVDVTGRPDALLEAVGGARPAPATAPGRLLDRVRRWASGHPLPASRPAAATGADDRWQGSFAMAAAISLLAMYAYQCLDTILFDLSGFDWPDPRLASDLSLGAAALLWAGILVPAWARHLRPPGAHDARPVRWYPVAGSTLGLLAGYYLWSPGTLIPAGLTAFAGNLPTAVAWSTVASLGISTVAVGLAAALGRPPGGRARRATATAAAVCAAAITMATGLSVSVILITQHLAWHSRAADRVLLVGEGDSWWWRWSSPALVLAAAVLAGAAAGAGRVAGRLLPRPARPVVAVAFLVGGALTTATAQLRIPDTRTDDSTYLLLVQRWSMCALAGAVVVAAVLLTRPRPAAGGDAGPGPGPTAGSGGSALPAALVAGGVTTLAIGLTQFARDALTGRSGRNTGNLVSFLRMPLWLLFVLVIVALPVALAGHDLVTRRRRRARPAAGRPRRLRVPATAVAVAVLAAAVATGVSAPLTISSGDYTRFQAIAARHATTPEPAGLTPAPVAHSAGPGTADPGRPLDAATASSALADLPRALPAGWSPADNSSGVDTGYQPESCGELFARDRAADHARPRTADETRTFTLPRTQLPPLGATIVASVTSYRSPGTAAQALDTIRAEPAACPQWSLPASGSDDGRQHMSIRLDDPLELPYPNCQLTLIDSFRVRSSPGVVTSAQAVMAVGDNVVSVNVIYSYLGHPEAPPERIALLHALVRTVLDAIVASLQRPT